MQMDDTNHICASEDARGGKGARRRSNELRTAMRRSRNRVVARKPAGMTLTMPAAAAISRAPGRPRAATGGGRGAAVEVNIDAYFRDDSARATSNRCFLPRTGSVVWTVNPPSSISGKKDDLKRRIDEPPSTRRSRRLAQPAVRLLEHRARQQVAVDARHRPPGDRDRGRGLRGWRAGCRWRFGTNAPTRSPTNDCGLARFERSPGASVETGFVPAAAARIISKVAAQAKFDAAAIGRRRVARRRSQFPSSESTPGLGAVSPDAARYVHLGATSWDLIDTAVVLCLGPASTRILTLSGARVCHRCLARRHASTPMAAYPVATAVRSPSAGLRCGCPPFLSQLSHNRGSTLQFGAGGTLSSYAAHGDAIAGALAAELDLSRATITWHGDATALRGWGPRRRFLPARRADRAR
jgi:hypothetical protein